MRPVLCAIYSSALVSSPSVKASISLSYRTSGCFDIASVYTACGHVAGLSGREQDRGNLQYSTHCLCQQV